MSSVIGEDSFERYARIVRAVIPDVVGLALCDVSGQPLQHIGFDSHAELLAAIEQLCDQRTDWAAFSQMQLHTTGDQTLLTTGLTDARKEVIATLAVLIAGDSKQSSINPQLEAVADCIEHEMSLDQELDSMTYELTERYEELNLVYHTEDRVNYFRQGQKALQDLTQNCLDYLDVSLAMLILRNRGVTISCSNPNSPIPDGQRVQAQLVDNVYPWVQDNGETVIIDNESNPQASSLLSGLPHKVLCCPIFENNGDVVGVLATVNACGKPVYSNSDRNLIQVMSRKASKIISANYDALTGLINRNGYEYFLESALAQVQAAQVEKCLLHINIDQLHIINDTIGYAAGDVVIRTVASIIDSQRRDSDTLGRIGGDEFGMVMQNCAYDEAAEFAGRICQMIEDSAIDYEGESHKVTVSIGVTMITPSSESVTQLVGTAELACSVAKDQGQNRVEIYRPDNVDVVRREAQMHFVANIQSALAEDRFELYCQPIVALAPGDHDHHTEILLRLISENGEVTEPDSFIPAAERYHLMPSIDRWVVNKALAVLSEYDDEFLRGGTFAINLSGQSLDDQTFLEFVHAKIKTSGIAPECLCFEITETAAVAKLAKAVSFMESLRSIGCSFSLDDFGSGISSFRYLKSLPVDLLKIDGAIIKDMANDEASAAMVVAINQVGHAMNLRTIAEFVENDSIKLRLKEIGVDYVQGFAIGMPERLSARLRDLTVTPAAVAS